MDTLQKEVATLHTKVDALYQVIEDLSQRVSEVLTELSRNPEKGSDRLISNTMNSRYSFYSSGAMDSVMEHKDVLVDSNNLDVNSQSSERELAPEIQIRRLTAQLTAAYNRIAALEEQLLSHRIH
ncbi:MAG: hypothetical protein KME16_10215 [Scytolyngbya sp. HA4215-MV1]|jgi:phage shock protein A|nr:hypothetical protein [Scytolyngbya sp. HA4215-MV1]